MTTFHQFNMKFPCQSDVMESMILRGFYRHFVFLQVYLIVQKIHQYGTLFTLLYIG